MQLSKRGASYLIYIFWDEKGWPAIKEKKKRKKRQSAALQARTRTQCCTVIAGSEGSMVVMVVYAYARVRTYLALSRYPEKLLEVLILKHQEFSVCCLVSLTVR